MKVFGILNLMSVFFSRNCQPVWLPAVSCNKVSYKVLVNKDSCINCRKRGEDAKNSCLEIFHKHWPTVTREGSGCRRKFKSQSPFTLQIVFCQFQLWSSAFFLHFFAPAAQDRSLIRACFCKMKSASFFSLFPPPPIV